MIKKFTYVASHIVFVMTCGIMWTRGGQFTFIHCNKTIKKLTNVDACIMFVTTCVINLILCGNVNSIHNCFVIKHNHKKSLNIA